jgi:hypothetical protein
MYLQNIYLAIGIIFEYGVWGYKMGIMVVGVLLEYDIWIVAVEKS